MVFHIRKRVQDTAFDALPVGGRGQGSAAGKIGGGILHPLADVKNHFLENVDFVKKERTLGEKDAAEEFAHTGGVLLLGAMEISGVDGSRFGNCAEMLRVFAECVEETFNRACQ